MKLIVKNNVPCKVRIDVYKRCGLFVDTVGTVFPNSRNEIETEYGSNGEMSITILLGDDPEALTNDDAVVVTPGVEVGEIRLPGSTYRLCFMAFACANSD